MGAKCSICSDRARRDLVNAALRSGDSPAEVLRRYGPEVVGSQSALYRHARAHLTASPLTNRWATLDSTELEVVEDLGQLRRSLLDDYATTRAKSGPSIAAARAAREATNVSQVLLREVGTDDETLTRTAGAYTRLVRTVQRASGARQGLALELAEVARVQGYVELVDDLTALEESATAYRKGTA